jgi:HK97 family phage portal protein
MSRPSGILGTEQVLTGSQMTELRAKFDEVSKGMNQGNVPILGNGLKWYPMSITALDSQVIETYNASVLDICRVFGVPIQLLGQETNGAASSVQTLIGQFKAGSLLYMAELIEFGLEELFKFDHIKDTVRFDLDNISRADFETEINTLSKGTQNGIFAPNEARNRVGLDSVPYGDDPRVQAQNVRLQDAVPAPSAPSAGQPAEPTKPEPTEPEDDEEDDATSEEVSKRLAILIKGYSSHA